MKPNELILCAACHLQTATQHLAITMELVLNDKVTFRIVKWWLCDECAAKTILVTANGQRMAETLVGGAA